MKLLFDENLSRKSVSQVEGLFSRLGARYAAEGHP
jgi:hypothetical protein